MEKQVSGLVATSLNDMIIHFDRTRECDGQKDRQKEPTVLKILNSPTAIPRSLGQDSNTKFWP